MDGEWRPCLFSPQQASPFPFVSDVLNLKINMMDIVWYHAEMSFQVHMYIKMRNGVTIFCSSKIKGGHRQSNIREAGQVKNH